MPECLPTTSPETVDDSGSNFTGKCSVVCTISRLYKTLERKVEAQTQALQQEIAERQQTEAALRQSEANYRNLLQTANSIIIRYDTQGRIHYINDYGVKLLGYEEHEIVGRTVFETIIPEAELLDAIWDPCPQFACDPQSYARRGENLCRDGRRVWVAWSNQAISMNRTDSWIFIRWQWHHPI